MTTPTPIAPETDADRRARLKLEAERTKQAIHANGVKEGRKREREELLHQAGAQVLDDIGLIASVTQAHQAELQRVELQNAREERKAVSGGKWRGRAEGLLGGLVIASLVFVFVIREMTAMAYERALQSAQQGVLMGAAAASQQTSTDPLVSPELNRDYTRTAREPAEAPDEP